MLIGLCTAVELDIAHAWFGHRDEANGEISRELRTAREFKREENALENIVNYFERVATGRLRNVTVIELEMTERDCLQNDLWHGKNERHLSESTPFFGERRI